MNGRFSGAYTPRHYAEQAQKVGTYNDTASLGTYMVPRERQREEIASDFYEGGMVVERGGQLHPALYYKGLLEACRRAEVPLSPRTRVATIACERGAFRLATTRGELAAKEVVVATNGYTDRAVPFLRRRILPIGSYIVTTEPLSEALVRSVAPGGRVFFDSKNFLYYWRLTADRRLIFGGRVSFLPTNTSRTARALVGGMLDVHPQLEGVRIEYAWGGKVGFTFDRMPHVGRKGPISWAMGYCGTGVCLSTYLGTRVGEWLAGGGPEPALARLGFPLVPAPYEGRPWFLPLVGEWYRLRDAIDRRRA